MEQEKQQVAVNRMGTDKVSKVMLSMGVPIILSMVLQACYNIVDSMFVARIAGTGESAVNALTLAFPVQMLIVALGIGTGVGINALLSRMLGEKDEEKVAFIAGNGVTLGIIIYVVFFIFGLSGIDVYLRSQTTDQLILEMGHTYLSICTRACIGMVMFAIYEKLLQATGKSIYSTIAMISGAVANIVLDPIMIFGYLGLPEMGIAGAAYATVIGQFVSCIVAMYFQYRKNHEIRSDLKYMKLKLSIVREIYVIGLPAIIMQALMSVMTYGVNIIFGAVSTAAVTAYGIFYKIQQFIFFAGFGLRDAITPIVSFNYGMGSRKRVEEGIRYGLIYVEAIMAAGIILLQVFAGPLVVIFGLSDTTAALCISSIRIISTGFLFAGANIALQGVFQALGCGISSLVISLLRLLVVVMPLAKIFSMMENAEMLIWLAFPIAELAAMAVALVLLRRVFRKIISGMKD